MLFENELSGDAIAVSAKPAHREGAASARAGTRLPFPVQPAEPLRAPETPRHPVAAALSWGMTQVVEGFALCGASVHLVWSPHETSDPAGWDESQAALARETVAVAERRVWARGIAERPRRRPNRADRRVAPDAAGPMEPARDRGPGWGARFASGLVRLWSWTIHEIEIRRMRAALQTLDDHALKDIGIRRHEIDYIVRNGRQWG